MPMPDAARESRRVQARANHLGRMPSRAILSDWEIEQAMGGLRKEADLLTAALADEHVPDDVAQRVLNRFLWGDPDGLFGEEKRHA